jgi:hypothetical protein
MSTIHIVKCQGKSKAELIKALEAAIKELEGDSKPSKRSVKVNVPQENTQDATDLPEADNNGEEFEDVPSPFGNQAPTNVLHIPSTPSTASAPVSSGDLDAEGLPWDERIHASSKAKVGNGTWRNKRGVDDATIFQVKNELRSRAAQSPVTTPPAPVSQPVYEAPAQPTHVMHTPVNPAPQQQAPAQPPMPTQHMSSGHTLETFKANFAMVIGTLIGQGKLSAEYIQGLCEWANVPQIWMVNDEQKAIMFEEFAKAGIVQKVG